MDELLEAFEQYYNAKKEYDKAYEECERDFSYFCYREIEALEKAKKNLGESLSAYIIATINISQGADHDN